MSQKSSVTQLPQFVPRVLTSDNQRRIGDGCSRHHPGRRHPEEADAGILLERIAGPSGKSLGGLSNPARQSELRGAVQSLYRQDFDAGRTRTIHGATLALTELRLCALATIELGK